LDFGDMMRKSVMTRKDYMKHSKDELINVIEYLQNEKYRLEEMLETV